MRGPDTLSVGVQHDAVRVRQTPQAGLRGLARAPEKRGQPVEVRRMTGVDDMAEDRVMHRGHVRRSVRHDSRGPNRGTAPGPFANSGEP